MKILKDQILLAKEKTDKLIIDVSNDKWLTTVDTLQTNINWQIGHIILANLFTRNCLNFWCRWTI